MLALANLGGTLREHFAGHSTFALAADETDIFLAHIVLLPREINVGMKD